jgi:hypothetical protein
MGEGLNSRGESRAGLKVPKRRSRVERKGLCERCAAGDRKANESLIALEDLRKKTRLVLAG